MTMQNRTSTLRHLLGLGLRFGLVGLGSVAVYFGVLIALEPVIAETAALTATSYVASAVFNYTLQSTFTFRTSAASAKSLLRYLGMHGICMGVNSGLMLIAVDVYAINLVGAQLGVTAIVAGLSFGLSYLWVYSDRDALRPPAR
jgi:putative flippase GtrA